MAEIENLSISISANAAEAIAEINKLASALSKFSGASNSAGNSAGRTADEVQDLGTVTAQAGEQTGKAAAATKTFGDRLKAAGINVDAVKGKFSKLTGGIKSFSGMITRVAKYRTIRAALRMITDGFKEGIKNFYDYSKSIDGNFAKSMDNLATSAQYLKNSLGTLAAPLVEALSPALEWIIDKLVTVINYINQFVALISGRSSYTAAVRVATTWSNAANAASTSIRKATDDMKRTILGFDEINKLAKESSGGGYGGGGGGGTGGGGGSYAYEEVPLQPWAFELGSAFESAMQDTMSRITLIIGGAELALGAILALTGANVPLGLGLIAAGAVGIGSALLANWDTVSDEVKIVVAAIEAALSSGLAVGAVLAFSGGNIPLGIGLMAGALATGAGAASIVSVNWDTIKEKLQGPIGETAALISGSSLLLGILLIAGGMIPLGIGLIVAGAAGLGTVVAANWDTFVTIGATAIEKIKEGWDTIKDFTIKVVASLIKKVGGWASDAWELISTGAQTIAKTVQAIGEGIATFATNAWMWIRYGAETIAKTVQAVGEGIATFATNAWLWIRNGAETVIKTVKAAAEGIASFASSVWLWIRNGAETIVKTVKAAGEGIASFVTSAWLWIRNGAETIIKTVQAAGEVSANFATSVWLWIRNGAETVIKTVKAAGEGISSFATSAWMWIRNGAETVVKTVQAGMEVLNSWVGSIVDFILGPESSEKKAAIKATMAEWAQNVCKFLADPAQGLKDMILNLKIKVFDKIWDGITSIWDLILSGGGSSSGQSWGDSPEVFVDVSVKDGAITGVANIVTTGWDGLPSDLKTVDVKTKPEKGTVSGLSQALLTGWAGLAVQSRMIQVSATIGTAVSLIAQDFRNNWDALTNKKKTVNVITDLTRTGSNWSKGKSGASGLRKWFNDITQKKGVSTNVNLAQGWFGTVANWISGNGWNNETVNNNVGLTHKTEGSGSWLSIKDWIEKNNWNRETVNNNVGLQQNGWSTLASWALGLGGTIVTLLVNLGLSNGSRDLMMGLSNGITSDMNGAILAARNVAMPGIAIDTTYSGSVNAASGEDVGMLADMIRQGVEEAMARERELLRQQNEYLRQINEKEFSADVSTSAINRANSRMNRRAGITVAPVGAM